MLRVVLYAQHFISGSFYHTFGLQRGGVSPIRFSHQRELVFALFFIGGEVRSTMGKVSFTGVVTIYQVSYFTHYTGTPVFVKRSEGIRSYVYTRTTRVLGYCSYRV